jgi:hypothetical protein
MGAWNAANREAMGETFRTCWTGTRHMGLVRSTFRTSGTCLKAAIAMPRPEVRGLRPHVSLLPAHGGACDVIAMPRPEVRGLRPPDPSPDGDDSQDKESQCQDPK